NSIQIYNPENFTEFFVRQIANQIVLFFNTFFIWNFRFNTDTNISFISIEHLQIPFFSFAFNYNGKRTLGSWLYLSSFSHKLSSIKVSPRFGVAPNLPIL